MLSAVTADRSTTVATLGRFAGSAELRSYSSPNNFGRLRDTQDPSCHTRSQKKSVV